MNPLRVLVIPGSARSGSFNRQLAACAAGFARETGAEVREFDLRSLALPIYDGDLEAASGVPEGAQTLLRAINEADALLIVTPEYNGFPTPLFINAFDWLSRISDSEAGPAGLTVTANKPVALLSASPGAGGALRSMNFLRQYLQMNFAMIVAPQQFALGKAHEAFNTEAALADGRSAQAVKGVVQAALKLARALTAKD